MRVRRIVHSLFVALSVISLDAFVAAAEAQSTPTMATDRMATPMMGAGRAAINTDESGLAIRGYDPVAYQTAMQPTRGLSSITASHAGATYQFASTENRDRFLADPARYVPAYGGYCAMGVAGGRKFDIDPMAFTIVEGRLYLNKDPRTRSMWMRDIPGNNTKADANWPAVMRQTGF
jgi:YHS domain-containing protein